MVTLGDTVYPRHLVRYGCPRICHILQDYKSYASFMLLLVNSSLSVTHRQCPGTPLKDLQAKMPFDIFAMTQMCTWKSDLQGIPTHAPAAARKRKECVLGYLLHFASAIYVSSNSVS